MTHGGVPSRALVVCLALTCAAPAIGCASEIDGPEGQGDGRARLAEVEFWEAFRAASAARREGDESTAVSRYERALEIDPEHGDSLYYLGQLRYRRGETAAASVLFERLVQIEPRGLRAWQQVSIVRGQPAPEWTIDLEGAVAAARAALELNRGESRTHLLLARWRAYQGRFAEAQTHLDDALGHNPGLWEAVQLRLWMLATAGERAAARQLARDAAERLCDGRPGSSALCPNHAPLHDLMWALAPTLQRPPSTDTPPEAGRVAGFVLDPVDQATWVEVAGPVSSRLAAPVAVGAWTSEWLTAVDDRFDGIEAPLLPGPILCAAAGDLDGDGDPDLVVAYRLPGTGGEGSGEASPSARLSWWRSEAGRLVPGGDLTPQLSDTVRALSIGDLDSDGRADIYVATAGPRPESAERDRLLLGRDGGFDDAGHLLGRAAFGPTRQLARDGVGALMLLRGGLVPADRVRMYRLRSG